jgi:N-succinyldiaminopimelate aminotransferase
MNRNLDKLHPYPFERFNKLLEGVESATNLPLIAWSLGEPKHPAPDFIIRAMQDKELIKEGFGTYPPTKGLPELRSAISDFTRRRFNLNTRPDPERMVLPVTGTREALFAFAQAVIDPGADSVTLMPNPFYQIYEGAALLAGSEPCYVNCTPENNFIPDFENISADIWQRCQLVYICTPGNPTGSVMSMDQLTRLIELSDEHNFIIASDECYSEIYFDSPPPGILEAASAMGRNDFRNCVAFNSLSKRSNLPGLRSGYVTGDPEIIEKFLLYRTYHGSAMSVHNQKLSTLAWQDEQHVIENRLVYQRKFQAVLDVLNPVWPMQMPDAGFYLWPETPFNDQQFATSLIELANVKVLPGSFLSRETKHGNPGDHRVRMALVAPETDCTEAANRIVDNWKTLISSGGK